MKHKTIDDIAKEAGVSKATVSRVMSKPHLVNEQTREKILSVINKYSYTPNMLAQGLAGMPTKTIGVVIDELTNDFYIEITNGIDSIISSENYSLQLMNSRWMPERELQGIRSMIINRVDGVLITPSSINTEAVQLLEKSGIPFILINITSDDPSISHVCCDNRKGGRIAAEYINTLNREQVIVIPVSGHQTVHERVEGFLERVHTKKMKIIKYSPLKTYEDGYKLAPVLVERDSIQTKKTAIFVSNDYVAMGIISRLLEMNISVPEQVSIVGFDDIRIASQCKIPLTTISQSIFDMGRIAALDLMNMIKSDDEVSFKRIVEPKLVIRESTSAI
ncbi:MAG: LacI family transcriptional regulator [Treponema sp.]|jgi:DNA-binding LacI/PurR family transcriptional regulator|nr:LacI family transcriptional regulator [Treponema sp.]